MTNECWSWQKNLVIFAVLICINMGIDILYMGRVSIEDDVLTAGLVVIIVNLMQLKGWI
jgi:hypothetical protein